MAGCCEHGDKSSSSIKGGESCDEMSDCELPKKGSACGVGDLHPACPARLTRKK